MWDYVGIVRTNKRLERALHRIRLLEKEIDEYYVNYRVGNDLIELRNLVLTAHLIVKSAQRRHESRGLHFSRDYPDTLPRALETVLHPRQPSRTNQAAAKTSKQEPAISIPLTSSVDILARALPNTAPQQTNHMASPAAAPRKRDTHVPVVPSAEPTASHSAMPTGFVKPRTKEVLTGLCAMSCEGSSGPSLLGSNPRSATQETTRADITLSRVSAAGERLNDGATPARPNSRIVMSTNTAVEPKANASLLVPFKTT